MSICHLFKQVNENERNTELNTKPLSLVVDLSHVKFSDYFWLYITCCKYCMDILHYLVKCSQHIFLSFHKISALEQSILTVSLFLMQPPIKMNQDFSQFPEKVQPPNTSDHRNGISGEHINTGFCWWLKNRFFTQIYSSTLVFIDTLLCQAFLLGGF